MKTLSGQVACSMIAVSILLLAVFSQAADPPVRLGYLQSDLHQLACFVALEKGYFSQEKVKVEVAGRFKAGPEEMSAFAARELDVGYVGAAPATVAVANRTGDIKIVAQANLEGSAIVTRKELKIGGLKHLIGKTVAVPGYATVQDFLIRKALKDSEIPIKSVNIFVLKPPEMVPVMQSGQIDAFVAWEPYPAKAVTSGVGDVFCYSKDIWPRHPCCVMVVDSQMLRTRPREVDGLLRAHVKATNYIAENFEDAAHIGVKYTGMDLATVKHAMKNITYACELDVQGLLAYVTFLKELGVVKVENPSMFVSEILVPDHLTRVLEEK